MSDEKKKEKDDYYGVAPVSNVMKKIKKRYDNDPKDWHIIGTRDKDGNTDTLITKKPNLFWLKSKQISPYSAISMGSVVRKIDRDIDNQIYGNELSKEEMLRLFGMVVPVHRDKNIVAAGIENYSKKRGDHIKKVVDERGTNIGYQMAKRIDEEFTKKFPQRKNMYI